ncbi:MAG: metallophosphoesterase [candidate division WOR-3 bacterium]|nr:metallophosphoesterase [candidate division WOR-3 bacterium]
MKRVILLAVMVLTVFAVAAPVRFAIIGDRTGEHQDSVYEKIVAEVARQKPQFVFTVGDQIEGYTEDTTELNQEWQKYKAIVAPIKVPLHLTPGNHDITTDGQLGAFVEHVGRPYYSIDLQGIHFIVLDASRWESSDKLPGEQLDWLATDLQQAAKAQYTIVFLHKPFWDGTVTEGRPDTLHKLFVKYGVDAVFAGHYHQYFSGTYDNIKYTVLGSSGGQTEPGPTGILYHWTMVTVDDKKGITIEPVLLGGEKRAWDDVTVADMRSVDRNVLAGLRFRLPALVGEDLVAADTVTLVVKNQPLGTPLEDTLRWDVPAGWSVSPKTVAVSVAAGTEAEYRFGVGCAGRPFPAPTVSLRMPYAPGKASMVKRTLRVARTASATTTRKPPVIDGDLKEKCWQNPERRFFDYEGGPAKTDSARFYFAADSANLYLAAVCFDPAVNTVKAQATEQDGAVYNDDCVGYFLQPDTGKGEIYQVYFNPGGIAFDQKITISDKGEMNADPKWNGTYEVKTRLGKDQWRIEVKIPLAQFGVTAKPGQAWGLNFRRKQPGRKANADWQPVSYDPSAFGLLLFR